MIMDAKIVPQRNHLGDDLVSVPEAARILHVSPSTIWRWIAHDTVPAYRVGPKRVWLKTGDLAKLASTPRESTRIADEDPDEEAENNGPLTPEERERALAALEAARRFQAKLLASRGGKPFRPSWKDLAEARDERTRELG
jgi:excisionase family DNA binding protein